MATKRECAVSVIVTSYNYAHFLRRALVSVHEQTEQDFELIVVDDGSTDDTLLIARAFTSEYPNLSATIVCTGNGGVSRARNLGIALARGRYVVCLDADDYFAPTALERMRSVLDSEPGISVVRPMLQIFGDVEAVWDWMVVPYEFDRLCLKNIAPYCAMFRRDAWEQTDGYDEDLPSWEDWDFWITIAKHGHRMGAVMEPLVHHRMSRDGKFARNLHRQLKLLASIVRNHPEIYGDESGELAKRILSGENVDTELADPPHPIFGWSL
ncbi:glycosyltransferase family 2 protein [Streptomyces sp. NPDC004752]